MTYAYYTLYHQGRSKAYYLNMIFMFEQHVTVPENRTFEVT